MIGDSDVFGGGGGISDPPVGGEIVVQTPVRLENNSASPLSLRNQGLTLGGDLEFGGNENLSIRDSSNVFGFFKIDTTNPTLTVDPSRTLSINMNNVFHSGSNTGLTKDGSGTLVLGVDFVSLDGTTAVDSGTLVFSGASAGTVDGLSGSGAVDLEFGTDLAFGSGAGFTGDFSVDDTSRAELLAANSLGSSSTAAITLDGALVFPDGTHLTQGLLDRVGASSQGELLVQTDPGGSLDFSSAPTDLAFGIDAPSGLTVSTNFTAPSNAPFRIGGGEGTLTLSGNLAGTGTELVIEEQEVILTGNTTYTGGTTVTGTVEAPGVLIFNNTGRPTTGTLTAGTDAAIGDRNDGSQSFLDDFDKANSPGTILIEEDVSGNLDLSGFHSDAALGTTQSVVISGDITPQGDTYRFRDVSDFQGSMEISGDLTDGASPRSVLVSGLDMTLSGSNNTFSGGLIIEGGTLSVSSDAAMGAAGKTVEVAGGSLVALDDFTTDRVFRLNGRVAAATGKTLTIDGQIRPTSEPTFGSSDHDGTIILNEKLQGGGTVTIDTGTVRTTQTDLLNPDAGLSLLGGTLELVGNISQRFGGKVSGNAASSIDLGTTGSIDIANADANDFFGDIVGSGDLSFDGDEGSTFDLSPDASSTFTGTVSVTGGTLTGSGLSTANIAISDGGAINPGSSPGTFLAAEMEWGAGGFYQWEIESTTGTAGTDWDLIDADTSIDITASSSDPYTLELLTLVGSESGPLAGFDELQSYSWLIATAPTITGSLANVFVDDSGFENAFDGSFSLREGFGGDEIFLDYTPVPEPAAFVLFAGMAAGIFVFGRRRRDPNRS